VDPNSLRSLERALDRIDRASRRSGRRFPVSALTLGIGLGLGFLLLTRFVPMLWGSLLPHGLDQAAALRGWPGVVWRAAVLAHVNQRAALAAIAGVSALGLVVGYHVRPVRWALWLAAVAVMVLDAAILALTLATAWAAAAGEAGLG
jgi:hypothetical protein